MNSKPAETIIRASSLTRYADCGRRWAAQNLQHDVMAAGYLLRPLERGIGAAVGTSVHAAASHMLAEKQQRGDLPAEKDSLEAAMTGLKSETVDGVLYDRTTATATDAEIAVRRLVRVYHRDVAPNIAPIMVEERLEANVWPGYVLSGKADVIAREPGKVVDLKTGTVPGSHAPQLGSYALLARAHGMADVNEAAIDFLRRVSSKKDQPPAQRFQVRIADAEAAALAIMRHIESDIRTFREGDAAHGVQPGDAWAFASNPQSKLCGSKYCPAWGTSFCRDHETKDEE